MKAKVTFFDNDGMQFRAIIQGEPNVIHNIGYDKFLKLIQVVKWSKKEDSDVWNEHTYLIHDNIDIKNFDGFKQYAESYAISLEYDYRDMKEVDCIVVDDVRDEQLEGGGAVFIIKNPHLSKLIVPDMDYRGYKHLHHGLPVILNGEKDSLVVCSSKCGPYWYTDNKYFFFDTQTATKEEIFSAVIESKRDALIERSKKVLDYHTELAVQIVNLNKMFSDINKL